MNDDPKEKDDIIDQIIKSSKILDEIKKVESCIKNADSSDDSRKRDICLNTAIAKLDQLEAFLRDKKESKK